MYLIKTLKFSLCDFKKQKYRNKIQNHIWLSEGFKIFAGLKSLKQNKVTYKPGTGPSLGSERSLWHYYEG